MRILGIDPGAKGWWCLIDSDKKMSYGEPLPFCENNILITDEMPNDFDVSYIEKIHINAKFMPASSAFKFGLSVGQLLCWLAQKKCWYEVSPKTWQASAFIGSTTNKEIKSISTSQFVKLNPEYRTKSKINHNMSDAFHIANYGLSRANIQYGRGYKWSRKEEILL